MTSILTALSLACAAAALPLSASALTSPNTLGQETPSPSLAISPTQLIAPNQQESDSETAPEQKDAKPQIEKGPDVKSIAKAVDEAVAFLLGSQENYVADPRVGRIEGGEKGLREWQAKELKRLAKLRGTDDAAEWPYEGVHRVGSGFIPMGYRVGGTSIVAEALLRSGADIDKVKPALQRSIAFVLDRLETDEWIEAQKQGRYDVRGWGQSYGLQFMLLALEHDLAPNKETKAAIEAAIPDLIERLRIGQVKRGGWNYANSGVSPFMTGATLMHLFRAVEAGYEVPSEMIEDALDALEDARTETTSYAYSGRPRGDVPMPASSARSACAELALFKAGRTDVDGLRLAIDGFFTGWDDLLVRKSQQGTHLPPYNIAPYYFFFGHTYAALAIEELPEKERAAKRDELAALLWRTREEDGSWNDRIFPRTASYSTAMTILALRAPTIPAVPTWAGAAAEPAEEPAADKAGDKAGHKAGDKKDK